MCPDICYRTTRIHQDGGRIAGGEAWVKNTDALGWRPTRPSIPKRRYLMIWDFLTNRTLKIQKRGPTFLSSACAFSLEAYTSSAAIISFFNDFCTSSRSLWWRQHWHLSERLHNNQQQRVRKNKQSPAVFLKASLAASSWWTPSRSVSAGTPSSLSAWRSVRLVVTRVLSTKRKSMWIFNAGYKPIKPADCTAKITFFSFRRAEIKRPVFLIEISKTCLLIDNEKTEVFF